MFALAGHYLSHYIFLRLFSYSCALSVTVHTVGWVAPPKMFYNSMEFNQEPNELPFSLGFNGPEFWPNLWECTNFRHPPDEQFAVSPSWGYSGCILNRVRVWRSRRRASTQVSLKTRGGTRDFKWRGWSKDFFGFEIFNSGIFWLGKFGKYFFG